jgi:hypothetical protein
MHGIFVVWLFSSKIILSSGTGMEVLDVCCVIKMRRTIKHLFFRCRFSRSIWSIIQVASTLYPTTSVAKVFGNWLHGTDLRFRRLIRMVALAVMWTLWLCKNNKINNDKNCSILQVFYRCTVILHLWSTLQRVENCDLFTEVCTRLDATTINIFSLNGWPHNLRIGAPPVS